MKNERGQILSMYPIMMVVILGLSGFVYDAGSTYVEKQRIQTIIKESMIAGSKYLPEDELSAINEVELILLANLENPDEYSIHVRDDDKALAIVKDSTYETVFWQVVGVKKLEFTNEEMIEMNDSEIEALEGLVPLALNVEDFEGYSGGINYNLKVSYNGNDPLSICRFYSDSKSNTKNQIATGYSTPVYLSETLTKKPGVSAGYLNDLKDRINSEPIIFMPVVEYEGDVGTILGFVKFRATAISKRSSEITVSGEFLEQSMDYTNLTTDIAPFYVYNRKFVKNITALKRWY